MCHGPAEARGVTIQDDVDQVVVGQLSIDVKSIDIIQVLLDSTCLFEITYIVKSPVRLIVLIIVLPDGVLDFSSSIEPMLVRLPPFQRIFFYTKADIGQPLYLVANLCNGAVVIHLKDPFSEVLHIALEFRRRWCFSCYHFWLMA